MFQLFTDFSTSIAAILHITHRKHISKTGWVLNLLTSSVKCCTERYRFRHSAESYTFLRASKAIYGMLYSSLEPCTVAHSALLTFQNPSSADARLLVHLRHSVNM